MIKIILAIISLLGFISFGSLLTCMIMCVKATMNNDSKAERKWDARVTMVGMSIMGLGALMILCGFFEWLFT